MALERVTHATRAPRRAGEEIPATARQVNPLIDYVENIKTVVEHTSQQLITPGSLLYYKAFLNLYTGGSNPVVDPRVLNAGTVDFLQGVTWETHGEGVYIGHVPDDTNHDYLNCHLRTSVVACINKVSTDATTVTVKTEEGERGGLDITVSVFDSTDNPSDSPDFNALYIEICMRGRGVDLPLPTITTSDDGATIVAVFSRGLLQEIALSVDYLDYMTLQGSTDNGISSIEFGTDTSKLIITPVYPIAIGEEITISFGSLVYADDFGTMDDTTPINVTNNSTIVRPPNILSAKILNDGITAQIVFDKAMTLPGLAYWGVRVADDQYHGDSVTLSTTNVTDDTIEAIYVEHTFAWGEVPFLEVRTPYFISADGGCTGDITAMAMTNEIEEPQK